MGCSNCKKKTVKKDTTQRISPRQRSIIEADKITTWIVLAWFLFGVYGVYSLIKDIISIIP